MDPLIRHSLRTGLITLAELSKATNIDEVVLVNSLTGNVELDKVSAHMALQYCTEVYKTKHHERSGDPQWSDDYGIRHADNRGCVHIPKKYREKAHTENFKVVEAIDVFGNPILIISGAHLPDPDFNFTPVEPLVMPSPEVNNG